jgi:hypothetical protein
MGYLFCAKCAQRRWADEQTYEDGMTLLTKGPLVAENCLCDSCNAAITINSEACLNGTDDESGAAAVLGWSYLY